MKKLILPMLALLLLLALPVSAQEAEGTCGEDLTWALDGSTLTISGSGAMDDFLSGAPWQEYDDEIKTVVFSDGVTSVGDYAFEDFDGITEVSFGSGMKSLGIRAFSDCDGLTRLSLPSSFKTFGQESLMNCQNLKAIHCAGGFPSFKLNCLWQTETKIYYPANRPWPVSLVQELEEAFSGRIEFLDSDGNDPYTPEGETKEPETTEPETTQPETTVPETTQTPAVPVTTTPVVTEPITYATETWGAEPWEPSEPVPIWTTEAPTQPPVRHAGSGTIGLAIIVWMLSLLGIGALLFNKGKKKRYSKKKKQYKNR